MEYEIHPRAASLPPMTADEYSSLLISIKDEGGINIPIKIQEGTNILLDGRHRLKACKELGIEPVIEEVNPENVLSYISSMMAHRNLTTKQRAAIAAEWALLERGTNRHEKKLDGSNELSTSEEVMTVEQAAQAMNVSTASVKRAKKVKATDPEEHEAAKAGVKKKKPEGTGWVVLFSQHFNVKQTSLRNLKARIDKAIGEELPSYIPKEDEEYWIEKAGRLFFHAPDAPDFSKENTQLSGTAQQRLDSAIRAAKKKLEDEFDWKVHIKVVEAVENYEKVTGEELKKYRDYYYSRERPLTLSEYKSLRGFCHPDKHQDEGMKAKAGALFDMLQEKIDLLTKPEEPERVARPSTLPSNVAEMMQRRR